jgi:hypothetical protein
MTAQRSTGLTTKFYASAVLSLALGAAMLATSVPARAEDDSVPLDTKIMRGIMESLGLKRDGEAINYQERAPLVIPPGRALPPPDQPDAALANNPAWPKDPDVSRRKLEAAQARNRNVSEEREREQNPLRPDQLTPGGDPRKAARRSQGEANSATPGDRLNGTELNQKGSIFSNMFGSKDEDIANFTKEPPRAALTEPPPGYQTPSPDQPYGVRKDAPKATNYMETHGTLDSGR